MHASIRILASAVFTLVGQALWASGINGSSLVPCTTATLSTYIAGANSGCSVGVLVSTFWGLTVDSGATLNSSQILVTPSAGPNGLGGSFSFSAASGFSFGVTAGQLASYFINFSYFIDPGPYLGDADLSLDPGNVTINQFFCNDLILINSGPSPTCRTTEPISNSQYVFSAPQTMQVTTADPTDSIVFNPPALKFGSIETAIILDGTNGPANFDSIGSSLGVLNSAPEPANVVMAMAGILAIGIRRKYSQSSR